MESPLAATAASVAQSALHRAHDTGAGCRPGSGLSNVDSSQGREIYRNQLLSSPVSFLLETDSHHSIGPPGSSGGAPASLEELNYLTVGSQTDLFQILQQERSAIVLDGVEYVIPSLFGECQAAAKPGCVCWIHAAR